MWYCRIQIVIGGFIADLPGCLGVIIKDKSSVVSMTTSALTVICSVGLASLGLLMWQHWYSLMILDSDWFPLAQNSRTPALTLRVGLGVYVMVVSDLDH